MMLEGVDRSLCLFCVWKEFAAYLTPLSSVHISYNADGRVRVIVNCIVRGTFLVYFKLLSRTLSDEIEECCE
jgi:hypothetical protein